MRAMVNYLVAHDYLQMEDGEFPVLSFTDKTMAFLKGDVKLLMRKVEERREKRARPRKEHQTNTVNEELFEILRNLRREISKEEDVPPYVVFSDKTLVAMCELLPKNAEEFLEIPGVGDTKLQRYGEAFIEAVNTWKDLG